jgi:hypothetical protein
MFYLKAKYLEVKELPERPPYPRSFLVSVLVGVEALSLVAKEEVSEALTAANQFDEVLFEVKARQVDLSSLGGQGKAYRLSIVRAITEGTNE